MRKKARLCFVDNIPGRGYTKAKRKGGRAVLLASALIGKEGGRAAGRQLLRQMYETHVGASLPEILRAENGKPYFKDAPWHFSISHTPRHVFCVLSLKEVGLDAEEMDRPIKLALADKILSEAEKKEYEKAEDKRLALLKFWVLKEAGAKFTGEGIRGYPNKTAYSLADPRVREMDGCFVAIIEEKENEHAV